MVNRAQENDEVTADIRILKDRSIAQEPLTLSPREEAAVRLGKKGDERAVQPLLEVLGSESESDSLRSLALQALADIGGEEVRKGLIGTFQKANAQYREGILRFLESGKLQKTGLSRADLLGVGPEELSMLDEAKQRYSEASTLWNKRQWKEAVAKYKEAIRLNPSHPYVHARLGQVYIELGDVQQAEMEFHKQIEVNADEFYSHAILSIIYDAKGMASRAREEETRAMNTSEYRQAPISLLPEYARTIRTLVEKKPSIQKKPSWKFW